MTKFEMVYDIHRHKAIIKAARYALKLTTAPYLRRRGLEVVQTSQAAIKELERAVGHVYDEGEDRLNKLNKRYVNKRDEYIVVE